VDVAAGRAPPASSRRPGETFVPFSDSRITLVALDPYRAVAFWDAVPRAIEAARRQLEDSDGRLAVCFHEISLVDFDGSNANETIRVDAPSPAGNYYLSLWSPGKCFVADLVVEAGDRTTLLARSNFIELPRDGESHRYEDRRRRVRGAGSPLWRQRGVPETIGSVMGHVAEAALASEDDDLEEAAAPLPPELAEMEGASAPEPTGPLAAAAADPAGAVHARAELAGEAVAAMADPAATAEATGARAREAAVRLEAGGPSSWVHALPGPRPEPAPPGISSLERPAIQDEPCLEVKADLVIYGRTRPGTDVVIDGVHVPVRPDGTFDLRFSLPPMVPRSPAATSGRARKLPDPARKLARKRPAREEP
jgi:hypothetical protein